MRSASYQPSSDPNRASARRRAISLGLALAAHILIVIALLRLAPNPPLPPKPQNRPLTFQLSPVARDTTAAPRAKTVAKVQKPSGGAPPKPSAAQPATPTAPAPAPPPVPLPPQVALLPGGMELFDSADISKLPSHPEDSGSGEGSGRGAGVGKDSASAYGPGEGPGGERLYEAEWYREPTHAEMAYYMPPGIRQTGWGMVACRTVANYRVENCRSLGESPVGSGLARTLRLAAWQFRVLPPRIGGRPVIGAWVRIRFDFTVQQASDSSRPTGRPN